ncbi:MAG: hypothetical protein ABSG53_14855 [Thermoguttaceae bacterium]|jgi:hypothetical protein
MSNKPLDEEDIFKAACKIGAAEARADYLKQACGDDRALTDRLAALLRVHDEEQSFLESPPHAPLATLDVPPIAERAGTIIGRYKLLEQIAEGAWVWSTWPSSGSQSAARSP